MKSTTKKYKCIFKYLALLGLVCWVLYPCIAVAENKTDTVLQKANSILSDTARVRYLFNTAISVSDKNSFQAEIYAQKALELSTALNFTEGLALANRVLGLIKYYQTKYSESLNYSLKSAEYFVQVKDIAGQSRALNLVALIYTDQGYYEKALELYHKIFKLCQSINDQEWIAGIYNNIGVVYKHQKNDTLAVEYFEKAADVCRQTSNLKSLGLYLQNIGHTNRSLGNLTRAQLVLNQSLDIRKQINDWHGLANSYRELGELQMLTNNINSSIDFFNKSLQYARQVKIKYEIADALNGLQKAYLAKGDYKSAYNYFKEYKIYQDSINSDDIEKKLIQQEMQARFEKEKEFTQLRQEKKDLQTRQIIEKQKMQRNAIIASLFIAAIVIILVYRSYRQKKRDHEVLKKQHAEIQLKNTEINLQKEEIMAQRDNLKLLNNELSQKNEEITAQRDEIEMQKTQIDNSRTEIVSSIEYAKYIQQAVLLSKDDLKDVLGNHFVLYYPRNIVSGDFFWATHIKQWKIFTVADCTGHGVPGAFMSMLGIAFLNEIVNKDEITQAGEVLNMLRQYIIQSLSQQIIPDSAATGNRDGMDMALCVLNTQTLSLQMAGANNPVYIVREQELIELAADKMPVSVFARMEPFSNKQISLLKNDKVYLFSDGFIDQFGGKPGRFGGKKYMSKNFKNLLRKISPLPMEQQQIELQNELTGWMQNPATGEKYEQTDDITVLGVSID